MRLAFACILILSAAACDRGRDPQGDSPAAPVAAIDQRLGLPLHPRARIVKASSTSGTGAGNAVLRLEAEVPPGDLIAFTRDSARRSGWTIRSDVNLGAVRMLGLSKTGETLTMEASARAGGGASATVLRTRSQGG